MKHLQGRAALMALVFVSLAAALPGPGRAPDNAVPFAVAARAAGLRAQATWPAAAEGTVVPYQDYEGRTVAWMFHYRVDGQPFPADYEQVEREGREDVERFEATIDAEPEAGLAPPTGRFRYAHVLVSARYDRAPVLAWGEGLSEYYTRLDRALARAAELLGADEPGLERIIYDGITPWFEFRYGQRAVVVHANLPATSRDAAEFREQSRRGRAAAGDAAELRRQAEAAWRAAVAGPPPTDVQAFVTSYNYAPFFDWSFGCTPTSAAMALGWFDKVRHFGRMVDWHYQRRDAVQNEEDYNVPNCQLELAVAMGTDTIGGTTQYANIPIGIVDVAYILNSYQFVVSSYNSNAVGDWCWVQAVAGIAANEPFVWSYDPPGTNDAHTMAVFGVDTDAKAYWAHTTWSPPGEWRHYSLGGDVNYIQADIIHPLIPDPNTYVVLQQPKGDTRYNANGQGEVWHAWERRYVTWYAPSSDSSQVFTSLNAGRAGSWTRYGSTTGGSMGIDLTPAMASDSARVRVVIFDGGAGAPNTAGDGSWGNFRIVNSAPPAPTIAYPANNGAIAGRGVVQPKLMVNRITYAQEYQFEIQNNVMGNFSSGWIADTAWRVPDTLPVGSTSTWRCQARNPTGTSGWSQATFTVVTDNGWMRRKYVMTRRRAVKRGGSVAPRRRRRIRRLGDGEDDEIVYLLPGNNTRDFLRYSAWQDSWSMACSLPAGVRNKKVKVGAALLAEEDYVFAFKGAKTNELYRYDPAGDQWESLPGPGFTKGMRYGFSAMVEREDSSRFIYAGSGNYNEWGVFDVDAGRWQTPTPAVLPVEKAKAGSSLAWDDADRLYFLCGGSKQNDFFALDLAASPPVWQKLAGLPLVGPSGKSKKAKEGAGLAWFQDKVYAVKGGNTREFWRYTPGADQWEYVNDVGAGAELPPTKGIKCAQPLAAGPWGIFVLIGNNTNEFFYYAGDPPEEDGNQPACSRDGVSSLGVMSAEGGLVANPVRGDAAALRWAGVRPGAALVSLFDAAGRCVLRQARVVERDAAVTLNLQNLTTGVYLVQVSSGGLVQTGKLVLQR